MRLAILPAASWVTKRGPAATRRVVGEQPAARDAGDAVGAERALGFHRAPAGYNRPPVRDLILGESTATSGADSGQPGPGPLDRRWLLQSLEGHQSELRRLGVERIGIFGSWARGDARRDSDVDVLVKFRSGEKTYDHYVDVKEALEALLGAPVDLVIEEALKPALRQAVLAETVYAAQF